MTPAEQLRAAKALIDTPERWTKKVFARNAAGFGVDVDNPDAVCFCSLGAIAKVVDHDPREVWIGCGIELPRNYLEQAAGGFRFVTDINDDHDTTHADIMKLFDDAIALAEAAQ